MSPPRVLVLGASGRLGQMLARHWGSDLDPVWQWRHGSAAPGRVILDPLQDSAPGLRADLVLGLAGVVPGRGDLALNTDLACAAVDLAAACGAAHVFLSSSAAVYGPVPGPLRETPDPAPASAYGAAKLAMEQAALARAAALGVAATALRIGNVAGADALLGGIGDGPVQLDRFDAGHGPRRSYIGPCAFARVMAALMQAAHAGHPLPARLNLALPGAIDMADLLRAGDIPFTWRTAPESARAEVVLDVSALGVLVDLPPARPADIIADWRADCLRQGGT